MLILILDDYIDIAKLSTLLIDHRELPLAAFTNDRALFARFARSNLNFQEPGNGDTKLSGKGRGEDTCYMSHVILAKLET